MDDPDITYQLGLCAMAQFQYQKAESLFKKLHQLYPEQEINSLTLAECYMMQKIWPEAIKLYQELTRQNPRSKLYEFLLNRAQDVVEREKYVMGKHLLNNSQQILSSGSSREALDLLLQAEQLLPNDLAILNNIGIIYSEQKKWQEAYTYLEKALKLAPDNSRLRSHFLRIKARLRR